MRNFLKNLFSKKTEPKPASDFSEEEFEKDYELKSQGLEEVLGKMHNMVGHAIIPFSVGGAVDMYYFRNHIPGCGFATMELLDPDGSGPLPNRFGTYELVAFSKHDYNPDEGTETSFNLIERRICGIFTTIGFFSRQALLNPRETCEIPGDEDEGGKCLVFDFYEPDGIKFKVGDRRHHLLLCMEIFRSEMEFAQMHGGEELLGKLKAADHYPYSDLDRAPVV
ncbi:suppressor of fused domain protein [Desertivirga brevis]|uniref:suppressor of fused domain protein n=1 Tax=Desertivirga brevis TaxID=2810310 RepID=UPI001A95E0B9|nr:suppressor of fused domain protein [Pedobacter sp. SYSU D00873]